VHTVQVNTIENFLPKLSEKNKNIIYPKRIPKNSAVLAVLIMYYLPQMKGPNYIVKDFI
jgi:hypothetical protein